MAARLNKRPSIGGGLMFTYSRPAKPRTKKPITKAMARQFKSEDRRRKFDQAMLVAFTAMGLIMLFQAI
ncbi:MAG: hypothetical protein P4L54_06405 [Acidocella sp.]|nr:hypothetical protein [Acidocella sp.]